MTGEPDDRTPSAWMRALGILGAAFLVVYGVGGRQIRFCRAPPPIRPDIRGRAGAFHCLTGNCGPAVLSLAAGYNRSVQLPPLPRAGMENCRR
jgi:hypothetical protein